MISPPRGPTPLLGCALLFCVLLLGGCAHIPTSGPVVPGGSLGPDVELHAVVPGPATGATDHEIVEGFLRAMISPEHDFQVARSYLSPAAASDWNPDGGASVYSGGYQIAQSKADNGQQPPSEGPTAEVRSVAFSLTDTIDEQGRLTQLAQPRAHTLSLTLGKVDGQWRITRVPDQVFIADSDLEFVFTGYNLFFFDPSQTTLVPDPRWLPQTDATSTRLVSLLLAGPPDWLKGSVQSAFPDGTRLEAPSSVVVENGVAQVELSVQIRKRNLRDRGLMRTQLLATLQQVLTVTDVSMRADGGPLEAATVNVATQPSLESPPAVLREGRVGLLRDGQGAPVPGLGLVGVTGSDPEALASDYSARRFALLTGQRTELRLIARGGSAEPLLTAPRLTAPSFDVQGWLWSTDTACDGQVTAISPRGKRVEVPARWLRGRTVQTLRVARDGVRALISSSDADGVSHVDLVAITRGSDGVPKLITPATGAPFGVGLVTVRDAVWVGPTELTLLAKRSSDSGLRVVRVELGGLPGTVTQPPSEATRITGALSDSSVLLLADGKILAQSGTQWNQLYALEGVQGVAFPG